MVPGQKIGEVTLHFNRRYILFQRHLQQSKPPGAGPTDWGPMWPLKWEIVHPQAARIQEAYTRDLSVVLACVSDLIRTLQTAALIVPQALYIERVAGLSPPDYLNAGGTWNSLEHLKTEEAAEIEAADPRLFAKCGDRALSAVIDAGRRISNSQVAYLASHNPLCEAALAMFLGGVSKLPTPNFAKGDMILFEMVGGKLTNWHYLPVPPAPSAEVVGDPKRP